MTWTFGSIFFSLFLIFLFPISMATFYLIMFRSNPFTGLGKDLDALNEALDIALQEKAGNRQGDSDDYWEYEDGEAYANTGPSVRHPKNRDRAYSGSVERFHDGGW